MSAPKRTPGKAVTELALGAVSLSVAWSFNTLFTDTSFFAPVALAATVTHVLAAVTRRAGWGLGRSALVAGSALIAGVVLVGYGETTSWGMPGSATLDALDTDARAAWQIFGDVTAPAPVEPGFVIALATGLALAAFLADWAAFRLRSPVEAVVPASALFVFSALLGEDGGLATTAAFLAAVLAFELAHHVDQQVTTRHWVNSQGGPGGRALVGSGVAAGALALAGALVLGPVLPGARAEPLVPWEDIGDDTPARVTVSPIVGIRSKLLDQPDVELFTVRADSPAYWRLTSLDQFDGVIWKSSGSFDDVERTLPRMNPAFPAETVVDQEYTIEALSALWLPAAFEPVSVDAGDTGLVYERESGTLIVDNERQNSDGLSYSVSSADPNLGPTTLTATGTVPAAIAERFLQLPTDWDPALTTLAQEWTEGATNPYDQARALQDRFRSEFVYDDQVQLRHDIDSIHQFLEVRRGYCEQFSGTFAALARALGLPARVAVGFTWGDPDAAEPDVYHVTGRHAHAWPEVWLPEAGWVPFEPTPSRGNPQATEVTGVAPVQASPPGGGPPQTLPEGTAPTTTTPEAPPVAPAPVTPGLDTTDPVPAGGPANQGDAWWIPILRVVATAAAVGALYAVLVVAAKAYRTRRRTNQAREGAQRIHLAWELAAEQLAGAGLTNLPAETHREYTKRVLVADGPTEIEVLARAAELAAFAGRIPDDDQVAEAEEAYRAVASWVRSSTSWWEQAVVALDPRPVLPQRRFRVLQG